MTWTPDDSLEGPAQPAPASCSSPLQGFLHHSASVTIFSFPFLKHSRVFVWFCYCLWDLLYKDYELSQPSLSSSSSLALFHPSGFNPNTILEIVFLKWPPTGVLSHHITFINNTYQDQKWLLSPTSPSCKLHRVRDPVFSFLHSQSLGAYRTCSINTH